MGLRKREVGEKIGLGVGEQPGNRREARLQGVDDTPELLVGGPLVGLLEDCPNR